MPYSTAPLAHISYSHKAYKGTREHAMSVRYGNFVAGGSQRSSGSSEDQKPRGPAAPQPGTLNNDLVLSIETMPGYSEARSSQGEKKQHGELRADDTAAAMALAILPSAVLPSHS